MGKTLVLGIDSGCWGYIDPLLEAGRMPNLAALIARGVRGVLESTLPPITPVAFSSFITGVNPGKHGVFDWSVRRQDGGLQMVNAAALRMAPFWTYLNQAGIHVGLFNIPVTYPPGPIDGFIVCGIPVPRGAGRFTFPAEILDRIEMWSGPYQVEVPRALLKEGIDPYLEAWLGQEARQTDLAIRLMEEYEVDVLVLNYAALDRINHFAPAMEQVERVLENVDAQIGRFAARYPDANFILMSDHGSRRVHSAFLLGRWLVQHGYAVYGEHSLDIPRREINFALSRYLRAKGMDGARERVARNLLRLALAALPSVLRRPIWEAMYRAVPEALEYRFSERLDWARTRAFATSNSGLLWIDRDGRNGGGRMGPQAYEALRDRLIRDLLDVRDPTSGQAVFSRIYRREEVYHGPAACWGPDIVLDHYSSPCDLVVDNHPGSFCFVDRRNRFGDHVREGILVLTGPAFSDRADTEIRASILDLPATLLHIYGVPVPREWDGQVLLDLLAEPLAEREVVRVEAAALAAGEQGEGYSPDEEAQVMDHLRGLGYL